MYSAIACERKRFIRAHGSRTESPVFANSWVDSRPSSFASTRRDQWRRFGETGLYTIIGGRGRDGMAEGWAAVLTAVPAQGCEVPRA